MTKKIGMYYDEVVDVVGTVLALEDVSINIIPNLKGSEWTTMKLTINSKQRQMTIFMKYVCCYLDARD